MVANRGADTKPEVALRRALHSIGLRFRVNHRVDADGLRVRPDIVFTRWQVCVFSDGCFWHRCPKHATDPKTNVGYWRPKLEANVRRDRQVDEALSIAGWTVVRIWEHEDPVEAADRIATVVDRRREARHRSLRT